MLRHYFIPKFNLLSVKLTPAAQRELLQLFDIIIERNISILKECGRLETFWSLFLVICNFGNEMIENSIRQSNKVHNIMNDIVMMERFESLKNDIGHFLCLFPHCGNTLFCRILSLFCKTPLHDLVLKYVLFNIRISSARNLSRSRNKCVYRLKQAAQFEMCSFDITTCKLWRAILLYMKGDYQSSLDIINQVLCSIPPYALHPFVSIDAEQMYWDVFGCSDMTIIQKAKKAWMFQMDFVKGASY